MKCLTKRSIGEYEQYEQVSSLVDNMLFTDQRVFSFSPQQIEELQYQLIRDAFQHHYHNNALYKRYCDRLSINRHELTSWKDLSIIPLLPSSLFKSMDISSIPPEMIAKRCLSSGTMGGRSLVNRDLTSLNRLIGTIKKSIEELTTVGPDALIFNLGPDVDEAGDLWIAYVMNMLTLLFDVRHYVRQNTFSAARLIEDIQQVKDGQQPILVGPPHLILSVAGYIQNNGIMLDFESSDGYVFTAGGWKRHTQRMIERNQFNDIVKNAFGMPDTYRIRDGLNLVELNTGIFECEQQCKHLPPWLLVRILDPDTLTGVEEGKEGLIAYLDPLASSYPCFILSDDFGYIHPDPCRCGRTGRLLTITRRVARVEDRGCALKMDRDVKRIWDRKPEWGQVM